jgi:hypothetical protein
VSPPVVTISLVLLSSIIVHQMSTQSVASLVILLIPVPWCREDHHPTALSAIGQVVYNYLPHHQNSRNLKLPYVDTFPRHNLASPNDSIRCDDDVLTGWMPHSSTIQQHPHERVRFPPDWCATGKFRYCPCSPDMFLP